MEESKIIQYFEGKTIFITGVTGFLAKIFLEKILRLQPNFKKVFLLIRENNNRSIEQRVQEEVFGIELFRLLREGQGGEFSSIISSKVVPILGDVSHENLGIIDSKLKEEMWREIDIIINSAATTKFDERYDVAFAINALGTMHVKDFAKKCSKLEMLLHVSTAFVHGTRVGVITEKPLHRGETLPGAKIPYLDINFEEKMIDEKLKLLQTQNLTQKEIARAMKDFGIERAMLHGWPNTYVFTKAMGEMLLKDFKEKANIIILRPTIITSTYKDPFPGWMEGLRTLDSIFVAYGKGQLRFFVGDPESTLDLIPGDMVVNCMLAAMAIAWHSKTKHDLVVYQIGSSRRNPVKYEEVKRLMRCYLTENPLLDSRGKHIKVGQPKILNTMPSFYNYISLHYMPFLQVLEFINVVFCNHFESLYNNIRRRISHSKRLAELYKPYLFSQAIFDDANTEKLRMGIRGNEMNMLNFDPNCIRWEDYLVTTHFRGIVKYVLN